MGDLVTYLFIAVIAGVIWWARNRSQRFGPTLTPTRHSRQEAVRGDLSQVFHWPGPGYFEFEVVGESFYQDALAELAGLHGEKSARAKYVATIVPEDDNPYDPKAVAVFVDGMKVAHLSRGDARSSWRRLGAKKLSGTTTSCDAIIVGGGVGRDGERLMYGIKLDIKPFE